MQARSFLELIAGVLGVLHGNAKITLCSMRGSDLAPSEDAANLALSWTSFEDGESQVRCRNLFVSLLLSSNICHSVLWRCSHFVDDYDEVH